jgi:hypothetical protein
MRKAVLTLGVSLLALTACGTEGDNNTGGAVSVDDVNLDQLEVEIDAPETLDLGEETELRAFVTQGEESIDDADEVMFEVWTEGAKSESEMVEADFSGEEGWYETSYTFDEEAHYHVQAHTTARGMHVMPVHEMEVGNPEEAEDETSEEHQEHSESEMHGGDEAHDHSHNEDFKADLQTSGESQTGEEIILDTEASWQEESWTEGEVTYEVWKHGDETREWIEADETEEGRYEAAHVFEEGGAYHIVMHASDENIHEHVEFFIEIKEEE